jgi:hypothetical protein
MKDDEKVELRVGDIKRAAEKCGTAKEVLKEMFPQVFGDEWGDWEKITGECRFARWDDGPRGYLLAVSTPEGYLPFVLDARPSPGVSGTTECVPLCVVQYRFRNGDIFRRKKSA